MPRLRLLSCAALALVGTATKPAASNRPPTFISATTAEVKSQFAAARRRLDADPRDTAAAHAIAKILRALGDIDGDATSKHVGFDGAGAAWALAAQVDVQGAVHYALRQGDHAEAQRLIRERLADVPECPVALELRALERRAAGDNEAAARFYDTAAEKTTGDAKGPALLRSALGRAAIDDVTGAEAVFEGLCHDGAGAEVWREYAFFLDEKMDDRPRAVAALRRAVALDPTEGQARCQLAKWGGLDASDTTATLDDAYVGGLFDQFAASFDEQLVDTLQYRGHLQCADVLRTSLDGVDLGPDLHCVDLGAGTGLCGGPLRRVLAPRTPHLTGVDLSPRMLERCATRGDHDAVVEGEAVAHLRRLPPESVDVIIAADVLAYVGDCAELFGEARRVLRTNGRLVFTLEESDEAGFGLGSGGRFVHSEVYLRGAAAAADLMVVVLDRGPMRSQGGTPVVALIAALAPIL